MIRKRMISKSMIPSKAESYIPKDKIKEIKINFGKYSLINLDKLKYGKTSLETATSGTAYEYPDLHLQYLSSIIKDRKNYCIVGYKVYNYIVYSYCEYYIIKVNPIVVWEQLQKKFIINRENQEFEINIKESEYVSDVYYEIIMDFFKASNVRVSVRDRKLSDDTYQVTVEIQKGSAKLI